MRFFNTEGPVDRARHYCLPPLKRLDLDEVLLLIEQQKYFLLHAPRQTGKTSCLLALADHLNREGCYRAVYANLEGAQAYREDVDKGMTAVVIDIAAWAHDWTDDAEAPTLAREVLATTSPGSALGVFLTQWCARLAQPLVLMLDEVDALVGDTLISLLRQLRAGYPKRPGQFPQTVCCAECATCGTTGFSPAGRRRRSPAVARSTSRPSRCAWAISPGGKSRRCC